MRTIKFFTVRACYVLSSIIIFGCAESREQNMFSFYGYALGTFYNCKYLDKTDQAHRHQRAVDSIFRVINHSMSTYIPESKLSRSNSGDTSVFFGEHFSNVFHKAKDVYEKSAGFFDPTVSVLNDLLSFENSVSDHFSEQLAANRKKYIGFDQVALTKEGKLIKKRPAIQMNFNAIAKGYAVDVIAMYFSKHNIQNFLIEVGGEVRVKGKNLAEKYWCLGVEKPLKEGNPQRVLETIVELRNEALATSGNYRKRYETKTGQTVVHTINPKTAMPFPNNMRSASVIAPNCMEADAYATAFMAMGFDTGLELLQNLSHIEVLFIYSDASGNIQQFCTPGFKDRSIDL